MGDLLSIASAQAAPLSINREPIDLAIVAAEIVRRIQPLATERHVRVDLDPAAQQSLPIVGDRERLGQLLLVLLDNALRHSRGDVQVMVRASTEGRNAILVVDDEGPGIPPEDRERIFEPFARLSPERAGDGGSGLGLAIARTIATAHGGTIAADDAPGGGARFRLSIPMR